MKNSKITRKKFIKSTGLAAVLAASSPFQITGGQILNNKITIQNVIDRIIQNCTGKPLKETVDTVKTGNTAQAVSGIAATFLADCNIIDQAIAKKCNFIITHEPTFYNHRDETDWLANDPVFLHKRNLLEKNNIVVWRCHDYIHSHKPDGVIEGMKTHLEWNSFQDPEIESLFHLPVQTLKDLVEQLKQKFNTIGLKTIGDPDLTCNKVALVVGAPGGRTQIDFIRKYNPDVIICGELNEWITNIYIKDAIHSGKKQALIVLGHAFSEQAGMKTIVNWTKAWYPEIPVHYIPDDYPFNLL